MSSESSAYTTEKHCGGLDWICTNAWDGSINDKLKDFPSFMLYHPNGLCWILSPMAEKYLMIKMFYP